MTESACPNEAQLQGLIDGSLPEAESSELAAHLDDCADCRRRLESLVGSSEQILIKGGRMTLGTWQAIYFCEFDGPRNRTIIIQLQGQ